MCCLKCFSFNFLLHFNGEICLGFLKNPYLLHLITEFIEKAINFDLHDLFPVLWVSEKKQLF